MGKNKKNVGAAIVFLANAFKEAYQKFMDNDEGVPFEVLDSKYERLCTKLDDAPETIPLEEEEDIHDAFAAAKAKRTKDAARKEVGNHEEDQSKKGSTRVLPKIELKQFDLSPRNYVAFTAQHSSIHQDVRLTKEEKLQYLLQQLKGRSRKVVESYPPCGENYDKAVETLKNRFGKDAAIIEVYTSDLIDLLDRKEKQLSVIYDQISTRVRGLETLGLKSENFSAMLYPLVYRALPIDVVKAWERERKDSDKSNPLEELLQFLEREVISEERLQLSGKKLEKQPEIKKEQKVERATAASLFISVNNNCIFCEADHDSAKCKKPVSEKLETLRLAKRCFRCFKRNHSSRFCRSNVTCENCKGRHLAAMCHNSNREDASADRKQEAALHTGNNGTVYLKTLMVKVGGKIVRALIDDGSTRSYLKKSLALELGLTPRSVENTSISLFGGVTTGTERYEVYHVEVEAVKGDFRFELSNCLAVSNICSPLPNVRDKATLHDLRMRGVELSDFGNRNSDIQLLIGADVLGSLLLEHNVVLKSGITAISTKLGWCVVGAVTGSAQVTRNQCLFVQSETKLWELDVLGIESSGTDVTSEDETTREHFLNSVKVDEEGRYEVTLPWRVGHPVLKSHRGMAEARLRSITAKNASCLADYHQVFLDWEREGIIEKVEKEVEGAETHYLPHRPVVKVERKTTKVRPVFDASAKERGGVSLNDCLYSGPNLLKTIPSILTNFRAGAIGAVADIAKAFCQISLNEKDRDSLRFLWWSEDGQEIIVYRHRRVVFGVRSSPYLLNATLEFHFSQERFKVPEYVETIDKLKNSFYCDDCVSSVDTLEKLSAFMKTSTAILQDGKFELCKWAHNGPEAEDVNQGLLGLLWNLKEDVIFCGKPTLEALNEEMPITKRGLLSLIGRVFDPMGFLCPAMLVPKLILQEAWRLKIGWDSELPSDLLKEFSSWKKYVSELESCKVPRYFHHGSSDMSCCQLHVFADGSSQAYGSVVYLRCHFAGWVSVNLVAAKARVVPPDKMTIPRIELLAAVVAVRLVKSLNFPENVPVSFWTDSSVALAWITNSVPWKTWVGNRVTEIRALSSIDQWGHVEGIHNPADLPSRGCDFKVLNEKDWVSGPKWLRRDADLWPCRKGTVECPPEALEEERVVMVTIQDEPFSSKLLSVFSEYNSIWRMVAYMLRFVRNARKPGVRKEGLRDKLTVDELNEAEKVIFRTIQKEWNPLDRAKCETSLQLVDDSDGLIRIETRLILLDADDEFKRPVVLFDHPLVHCLIKFLHLENCHAGVGTILTIIRARFWLLKGRSVVKKVVSKCVVCKRYSTKNVTQESAPLPRERIEKCPAFTVVGVDLTGPLTLKGKQKGWIVLYTCAVYRAVHLELVTSLSTEAFMMSFRRFIARRGRPTVMWSDRGTNFTGMVSLIGSLNWDQIVDATSKKKIDWRFNPPAAPWWGGWWERLIGVVKLSIRKVIGRAYLSYEELLTVLADVESTVNSRPLTYVPTDSNELKPLTPWLFLGETEKPKFEDLDAVDSVSLLKRVQYVQNVRNALRVRFQEEYLGALASRPQHARGEVKVGDLVLVHSEGKKRVLWPMGKILEVMKGKDSKVRVVRVLVQGNELIRPVERIYPLEISHDIGDTEQPLVQRKSNSEVESAHESETIDEPETAHEFASSDESESLDDLEPLEELGSEPAKCTARGRLVRRPTRLDL